MYVYVHVYVYMYMYTHIIIIIICIALRSSCIVFTDFGSLVVASGSQAPGFGNPHGFKSNISYVYDSCCLFYRSIALNNDNDKRNKHNKKQHNDYNTNRNTN